MHTIGGPPIPLETIRNYVRDRLKGGQEVASGIVPVTADERATWSATIRQRLRANGYKPEQAMKDLGLEEAFERLYSLLDAPDPLLTAGDRVVKIHVLPQHEAPWEGAGMTWGRRIFILVARDNPAAVVHEMMEHVVLPVMNVPKEQRHTLAFFAEGLVNRLANRSNWIWKNPVLYNAHDMLDVEALKADASFIRLIRDALQLPEQQVHQLTGESLLPVMNELLILPDLHRHLAVSPESLDEGTAGALRDVARQTFTLHAELLHRRHQNPSAADPQSPLLDDLIAANKSLLWYAFPDATRCSFPGFYSYIHLPDRAVRQLGRMDCPQLAAFLEQTDPQLNDMWARFPPGFQRVYAVYTTALLRALARGVLADRVARDAPGTPTAPAAGAAVPVEPTALLASKVEEALLLLQSLDPTPSSRPLVRQLELLRTALREHAAPPAHSSLYRDVARISRSLGELEALAAESLAGLPEHDLALKLVAVLKEPLQSAAGN